MKLPIKPETLKGKVVVITGAGGVICGAMAKAVASCGAKVAVLDRLLDKAEEVASEIRAEGGCAKAYQNNVLDREDLKRTHEAIVKDLGLVDVLINGAGGNSPKATTTQEYYEAKKADEEISFFDLKQEGVEFVFDLNFLGTFLP